MTENESMVCVPLRMLVELVREDERVSQAVNYICGCEYSPDKDTLLTILTGEAEKKGEE